MNAPPSQPPYLFYSPKCPHSNQLIEMIKKNHQLAKVIQPINIHTAKSLPPQLDGVPAILFRGQLLVGPDTFKWVQFQTPQDNRPSAQSGMGEHPSIQGGNQQQENNMEGIPNPADISSHTKIGIDFTPLPGQEEKENDPTIPRFSFLPGESNHTDGTVGIDTTAAMENTENRTRSHGVAQQLERLQQLRGQDTQTIEQAMGGGPYGQQQAPSWQQGGQGGQGGYQQQGYVYPQQANQNQVQAPAFGLQGQQVSSQMPQGYGNMYQEQTNQYSGGDGLPKRW